jgi:multidrug efflux pump
VAAYRAHVRVAFAVVSHWIASAFHVPIAFLQGDIGRLFSEFALTMAAALAFQFSCVIDVVSMMLASGFKSQTMRTG